MFVRLALCTALFLAATDARAQQAGVAPVPAGQATIATDPAPVAPSPAAPRPPKLLRDIFQALTRPPPPALPADPAPLLADPLPAQGAPAPAKPAATIAPRPKPVVVRPRPTVAPTPARPVATLPLEGVPPVAAPVIEALTAPPTLPPAPPVAEIAAPAPIVAIAPIEPRPAASRAPPSVRAPSLLARAWPWLALVLLGAVAAITPGVRRARRLGRTRAALSLTSRLAVPDGFGGVPDLAFAKPPIAIRARLVELAYD